MDEPGLDAQRHARALDALGRANAVSGTSASLWPFIRAAARSTSPRPLRVLDLACGGGHVVVSLARRAARHGIRVEWIGWDVSAASVEYARTLAVRRRVQGVRFEIGDALRGPMPDEVDVALCTLFLHHLEDADAATLLRKMTAAARTGVAVSDLRRTSLGAIFTWVACHTLSASDVFRIDGMRSIRAAFTTEEARRLADEADLQGARVSQVWPQRWLLEWRRDGARP
jgi:2-polyprenyl-3-methyl-5-hydroxy-6-metoxy-1,4-benzoquinol methylase